MWHLALDIFESLATRFPICMASDEFHYFPQYKSGRFQWSNWDDFSPSSLSDLITRMSQWEKSLAHHATRYSLSARAIEARMLHRIVRTLHEQFTRVRFHENQPTFYLTIVGIGLAEAIESGPRALGQRVQSLPAFLDQAAHNLTEVPRLFRDLGLDMLSKQQQWIDSMGLSVAHQTAVHAAFERLESSLQKTSARENHLPPVALYERIVFSHMGCQLTPDAITRELDREIEETRSILVQSAETIAPGNRWQTVVDDLETPPTPPGGVYQIYDNIIAGLAEHCAQQGIVEPEFLNKCPVTVAPIPEYMRPVRSNAAYSMPPGHPPRGGTFYILESSDKRSLPVDYRLLAAHETYPGHHVLDAWRWRHQRPVRRHMEFPIFYEGWASFAEELMFDTAFFSGPENWMIMAKRRFWRAMRGKADLDIHTGRCTLDEAAAFLVAEGISPHRARAMVQRYSLKPGYQLAYTIGRRRFRRLYDAWKQKGNDPGAFARQVFSQGEIGLDDLEELLQEGGS
jgi:uncharacterized protein (DUF885 family)